MPTIAFLQSKGGSGKTTAAVLIAHALAREDVGASIGLCDLDSSQGATEWLAREPHESIKVLQRLTNDEEVFLRLIDTEGRSPVGLENILMRLPAAVDLFIVPCSPSRLDVRGAIATVGMIKAKRPDATIRLLWNRINSRARNGQPGALATKAAEIGATAFKGYLARSTRFESAVDEGWMSLTTEHRAQVQRIAVEILILFTKRNGWKA